MHSDLLCKAASVGKKFNREETPADGGWTDTFKYDDKGCTIQVTDEDQNRQGKTTGGNSENLETRRGRKVVDTFTSFDKDRKPTDRLTKKYDGKERLRYRRHEYFDKNGNVVGGTQTTYIYDAEGRITEEQTSLP